jgi:hypothetical protein
MKIAQKISGIFFNIEEKEQYEKTRQFIINFKKELNIKDLGELIELNAELNKEK